MIKKILTASLGVGMVLAAVAPAFAGVSVYNTGQGSTVDARLNRIKTHVLTVTNSYTLTQPVASTQTTGGNTADNNTGDGLTSAGNQTANHTSQVEANTTNVDIDATDNATCDCDNVTVNTTGQDSTVNAIIDANKTVVSTITNLGTVTNTLSSIVNTGGNTANNNTGNGTAIGGDSSIWSLVTTKLNSIQYKVKM